MTAQIVNWKGVSGKSYQYTVHALETNWNDVPGNYIFAKLDGNRWTAIYIGETESFAKRLPNHEKWPCVRRYGATAIHAHVNNSGTQGRRNEEQDLIALHDPPCNE